jgi:hypothetical protein
MEAKLAKRVVQNRIDSGQVSLMILAEGKTLWRGQTQQRGHQSSITFIELFVLSLFLFYFIEESINKKTTTTVDKKISSRLCDGIS